jgi:hypothetical protein
MVYVDLNMVRAGVVKHPSEWAFCGYNEIQSPPKRYGLVDIEELMELIQVRNKEELKEAYQGHALRFREIATRPVNKKNPPGAGGEKRTSSPFS